MSPRARGFSRAPWRAAVLFAWLLAIVGPAIAGEAGVADPPVARRAAGPRWFPASPLFRGPLASEREPRFEARAVRADLGPTSTTLGIASFGGTFGIVRWTGRAGWDWQIDFGAGAVSVFDLGSGDRDLWNTDFLAALPLSVRRGAFTARARLYHRSSHLGDELLIREQVIDAGPRIELSYEAIELLASYEHGAVRVYGGGTRFVGRAARVGQNMAQLGAEIELGARRPGGTQAFAALDASGWSETGWDPEIGLRLGLAIPAPWSDRRRLILALEARDGPLPFGQLYGTSTRWIGLGVILSD